MVMLSRKCIITYRHKKMKTKHIQESYQKIGEQDFKFDIQFWQAQGEKVIFEAAMDMVTDYYILKYGNVIEPKLQRDIESFHQI